jgi:hypothetical protein
MVATDSLIEETFQLIKQLDETDDPVEAATLEARIAERSDELGSLDGFGIFDVAETLFVVCLDREQAAGIQKALLTTEGGFVAVLKEVEAPLCEFVHPETSVAAIVAILVEGETGEA